MMNQGLFNRVKEIYDRRDSLGLAHDEIRAVEETYRQFARNGALLPADKQEQLKAVNSRLTDLYLKFNKNLLAANNAFEIVVDNEADLDGIPASTVANAQKKPKPAAKRANGSSPSTPVAPSVLQYADNRDLREKMWKGYTNNAQSVKTITARLSQNSENTCREGLIMGYPDFASYMTEQVMAKTPQAAEDLLMSIWTPAKAKVEKEVAEMQALSDKLATTSKSPLDYYYFAEKVRQDKYALDENEIRPYFAVDSVTKGIFTMAKKLYASPLNPLRRPRYHPDVKVYDVKDPKANISQSSSPTTSHAPQNARVHGWKNSKLHG